MQGVEHEPIAAQGDDHIALLRSDEIIAADELVRRPPRRDPTPSARRRCASVTCDACTRDGWFLR